ncbi:MAG: hypothetical protein ABH885_07700, partial [Candidatus Omnitrophota bacterium]
CLMGAVHRISKARLDLFRERNIRRPRPRPGHKVRRIGGRVEVYHHRYSIPQDGKRTMLDEGPSHYDTLWESFHGIDDMIDFELGDRRWALTACGTISWILELIRQHDHRLDERRISDVRGAIAGILTTIVKPGGELKVEEKRIAKLFLETALSMLTVGDRHIKTVRIFLEKAKEFLEARAGGTVAIIGKLQQIRLGDLREEARLRDANVESRARRVKRLVLERRWNEAKGNMRGLMRLQRIKGEPDYTVIYPILARALASTDPQEVVSCMDWIINMKQNASFLHTMMAAYRDELVRRDLASDTPVDRDALLKEVFLHFCEDSNLLRGSPKDRAIWWAKLYQAANIPLNIRNSEDEKIPNPLFKAASQYTYILRFEDIARVLQRQRGIGPNVRRFLEGIKRSHLIREELPDLIRAVAGDFRLSAEEGLILENCIWHETRITPPRTGSPETIDLMITDVYRKLKEERSIDGREAVRQMVEEILPAWAHSEEFVVNARTAYDILAEGPRGVFADRAMGILSRHLADTDQAILKQELKKFGYRLSATQIFMEGYALLTAIKNELERYKRADTGSERQFALTGIYMLTGNRGSNIDKEYVAYRRLVDQMSAKLMGLDSEGTTSNGIYYYLYHNLVHIMDPVIMGGGEMKDAAQGGNIADAMEALCRALENSQARLMALGYLILKDEIDVRDRYGPMTDMVKDEVLDAARNDGYSLGKAAVELARPVAGEIPARAMSADIDFLDMRNLGAVMKASGQKPLLALEGLNEESASGLVPRLAAAFRASGERVQVYDFSQLAGISGRMRLDDLFTGSYGEGSTEPATRIIIKGVAFEGIPMDDIINILHAARAASRTLDTNRYIKQSYVFVAEPGKSLDYETLCPNITEYIRDSDLAYARFSGNRGLFVDTVPFEKRSRVDTEMNFLRLLHGSLGGYDLVTGMGDRVLYPGLTAGNELRGALTKRGMLTPRQREELVNIRMRYAPDNNAAERALSLLIHVLSGIAPAMQDGIISLMSPDGGGLHPSDVFEAVDVLGSGEGIGLDNYRTTALAVSAGMGRHVLGDAGSPARQAALAADYVRAICDHAEETPVDVGAIVAAREREERELHEMSLSKMTALARTPQERFARARALLPDDVAAECDAMCEQYRINTEGIDASKMMALERHFYEKYDGERMQQIVIDGLMVEDLVANLIVARALYAMLSPSVDDADMVCDFIDVTCAYDNSGQRDMALDIPLRAHLWAMRMLEDGGMRRDEAVSKVESVLRDIHKMAGPLTDSYMELESDTAHETFIYGHVYVRIFGSSDLAGQERSGFTVLNEMDNRIEAAYGLKERAGREGWLDMYEARFTEFLRLRNFIASENAPHPLLEFKAAIDAMHWTLCCKRLYLKAQTDLRDLLSDSRQTGQSVIIYADDMFTRDACIDLPNIVGSVLKAQNIISGGKIILFSKEETAGKALEWLIHRAAPDIEVIVVTERQMAEQRGGDGTAASEARNLICFAASKGVRQEDIIGVIRGPIARTEDVDALESTLAEYKTPLVSIGYQSGIYSFAQAILKAISRKMDYELFAEHGGRWPGWIIILDPIHRITQDVQELYDQYRESLKSLIRA